MDSQNLFGTDPPTFEAWRSCGTVQEIDMAIGPMRRVAGLVAGALMCGGLATEAAAHPHVYITFETTVLYDKGTFAGVRHKWTFDEFYTTMAIEGLDKNKDGVYDREELAELAKVNIEGLKDFAYFTFPGARPARRLRSAMRATTGSSTRTASCRCTSRCRSRAPCCRRPRG